MNEYINTFKKMSAEEYEDLKVKINACPLVDSEELTRIIDSIRAIKTTKDAAKECGMSVNVLYRRLVSGMERVNAHVGQPITMYTNILTWSVDNVCVNALHHAGIKTMKELTVYVGQNNRLPRGIGDGRLEKIIKDYKEAALRSGRDRFVVNTEVQLLTNMK